FQKLFDQPLMKGTNAFGSTDLEIRQFFPVWHPVIVEESYLVYQDYPFEPSKAFQEKYIPISSIQNIDLQHSPPTLLFNKELNEFPASQKEYHKILSSKNNIPFVSRPYI